MRPRKVVTIVGALVLVAVLLICGLMYTTDQNEADDIVSRYNKNTHQFDRTTVVTLTENIKKPGEDEVPDDYNEVLYSTDDIQSFLDACKKAHHLMYHAGFRYSTSDYGDINGFTVPMDCSGYVGVAMYLYGLQSDMSGVTENSLANNGNLENKGELNISEYEPGDILVYDKHVEVFVQTDSTNNGTGINVYQWGNSKTAEGLYSEGVSDHSVDDCTTNILTTSGTYGSGKRPTVYRIKSSAQPTPAPAPSPQPSPDPGPNPPGIVPEPSPAPEPSPNPNPAPMPAPSSWLEAITLAHRSLGHAGCVYKEGGGATLPNGDVVRTDCSGFVSYALQVYGLLAKGTTYSSGNFNTCPGFTDIKDQCTSFADVQPGDIVGYYHHVEIYAGNNRVYNWGSHYSAQDKYTNCDSHDVANCSVDTTINLSREWTTVQYVLRMN